MYPEVREMCINPLMHFMQRGWREGKNPSENFNTKLYLELHPDVENVGINPLVHYIRFGKKDSRVVEHGASEEIQTEYIDLRSKTTFE